MPFPFPLPTTSATPLPPTIDCLSHPSLPHIATTHRSHLRTLLKRYKRLPPQSRSAALPQLITALTTYLSFLLPISRSIENKPSPVNVVLRSPPKFVWRSVLGSGGAGALKGRKGEYGLDDEIVWVGTALSCVYSLVARAALQPIYVTSGTPLTSEARTAIIQSATKSLLTSAAIAKFFLSQHTAALSNASSLPFANKALDISPHMMTALQELAHAEATLLAILKDDPYPAILAQSRNQNDKEWMYKAPTIPKVRTLLLARLCLAAAEHAETAEAAVQSAVVEVGGQVVGELAQYIKGIRKSSRARACRFFGVEAEMGGQTGVALGWLGVALAEMDLETRDIQKKGIGKLKYHFAEKREDRKIAAEAGWGADGGVAEEVRVIGMLLSEWERVNDRMLAQTVSGAKELRGQMPMGRDCFQVGGWELPVVDEGVLDGAKKVAEGGGWGNEESSGEEDEDNEGSRGIIF